MIFVTIDISKFWLLIMIKVATKQETSSQHFIRMRLEVINVQLLKVPMYAGIMNTMNIYLY